MVLQRTVSGKDLRKFRQDNSLTVARAAHLADTTERLIMDHENDDPSMLLSQFNRMQERLNREPTKPTSGTGKPSSTKTRRGCCG